MKNLICSFLVILSFKYGNAQTSIAGGTSVSGTWTSAGSPYLLQGAVMIANDSTLTIQPGVQVIVQGSYKILVLGRLIAEGNVTDSIVFMCANTSTGWLGVHFDNTTNNNDTSKLRYCKIQHTITSTTNGGAIYFNNFSKGIISNCMISDNQFSNVNSGGGVSCVNGAPIVQFNTFKNNSCAGIYGPFNMSTSYSNNLIIDNQGYGIYCGDGVISNNTILRNVYGGIQCNSATIQSNVIDGNGTAGGFTGGIRCSSGSVPVIKNNIISNNLANEGAGIFCKYSQPVTIADNIISNNLAAANGGGLLCGNNINVNNNTFVNNQATDGGGIYASNSGSTENFVNNTIANNQANYGGGIFLTSSGTNTVTLSNCILWGNLATNSGNNVYIDVQTSKPNLTFCDVAGGSAGFGLAANVFYLGTYTNNVNSDPLFVSASSGPGVSADGVAANWTLQSGSPCVDAGNPLGTYPTTDLAGNPRVINNVIDIGAYEYQGAMGLVATENNNIVVAPNPATNYVKIDVKSVAPSCSKIFTIDGHIVAEKVFVGKTEFLISELQAGVYFIETNTNGTIRCTKLIVTK